MLSQSDYLALDATALAEGIRRHQFRCSDVTAAAIERAEAVNPRINAIVTQNYELALAQAACVDATPELLQRSSLSGLPFLIKDLTAVAGLRQTSGSRLFEGFTATNNAAIVQKYLDAGLIVMGKTNTPEFGLTLTTEPVSNGITRNPWNLGYSTGGSSGGAAAAVAAGILPVAHATDGGGSIRIPAACCGLFGLKPSRGLTAIEDSLADCWSGMSVGHVVSQTVRDSAAFLDLIKLGTPLLFSKPPAAASFQTTALQAPRQLRIALQTTHPFGESIDTDCIAAVLAAGKLCSLLGHSVEKIGLPLDYRDLARAMSRMINLHVWQATAPRLAEKQLTVNSGALERSTSIMAENGRALLASNYVEAWDSLRRAEQEMERFHTRFDVIISPVLAKIPARIGWLDMNSADMHEYSNRFKAYSGFTSLYNGTGQPSMSVPLYRTQEHIPVGVMFSAAWGADALLLQLATQLEQAQPWPRYCSMDN